MSRRRGTGRRPARVCLRRRGLSSRERSGGVRVTSDGRCLTRGCLGLFPVENPVLTWPFQEGGGPVVGLVDTQGPVDVD